jgi:hypothetical protein
VSTRKLASEFYMKKNWMCRLFSSTMFSTTSFKLIEYSARCRNIYFLLESAEAARQVPLSLERFYFLTFVQTTLSRFVAWLNRLSIFQIKVSNKCTGDDFDDDLWIVLRRFGCKGEKICFIMDESNVLDSGFLERMNTLLANAEVPGLFEGDEYAALMTACKEGSQRAG